MLAAACVLALTGCATRPARPTVASVSIHGAVAVDPGDVAEKLATRPNSTVLGLHLAYELYDRFVVERDVKRIERYYRSRGFFRARVLAGRVTPASEGKVDVELLVEEGPPTKLTTVRVEHPALAHDAAVALA